ncbi:hypothetical protein GCM10011391_22540 [Pullulanibacillus camelliae]|uniref:Uncharacterized protein n=1 Tax=Pullulanibacillus camelliae TaxID=1707096 RepID=A0A8J2YHQ4_9BACL|nr:hypothetical protein GCM10011391_22540 [Pullulanibacillus camelliae]
MPASVFDAQDMLASALSHGRDVFSRSSLMDVTHLAEVRFKDSQVFMTKNALFPQESPYFDYASHFPNYLSIRY